MRVTAFHFTAMQTQIKYNEGFYIPRHLPHAKGEDDIFGDDIRIIDGELVLSSLCGETRFPNFEEDESGGFRIPSGTRAQYCGAYAALNAVWGIEFPAYELGEINSQFGRYRTQAGYELARRAIVFARMADRNAAVQTASDALDQIADRIGNPL